VLYDIIGHVITRRYPNYNNRETRIPQIWPPTFFLPNK